MVKRGTTCQLHGMVHAPASSAVHPDVTEDEKLEKETSVLSDDHAYASESVLGKWAPILEGNLRYSPSPA